MNFFIHSTLSLSVFQNNNLPTFPGTYRLFMFTYVLFIPMPCWQTHYLLGINDVELVLTYRHWLNVKRKDARFK